VVDTIDFLGPDGQPPHVGLPAGLVQTGDFTPSAGEAPAEPDCASVTLVPLETLWAGTPPVIPGYEILEELGRGGMSVVYKAHQVSLNRPVALKVVRQDLVGSERLLALRAEARAVAQLNHPNIVHAYEMWEYGGVVYFALEYCPRSLREQLDGTPWPVEDAVGLVFGLARALDYAHERGILHGDLKPANVLLAEDGTAKIADFGVAALLDLAAQAGDTGVVIGTPAYMAPEQAAGKTSEVGPATDIHGLGVLLYELLTGRAPFLGASFEETFRRVMTEEPLPPSRLRPSMPADLDAICLRCLRKALPQRYPSAGMLAEDLERFLRGVPLEITPPAADALAEYLRRLAEVQRTVRGRDRLIEVLLANAADGVLVLDAAGRVTRSNEAAEHLFGHPLAGLALDDWVVRGRFFLPDRSAPCTPDDFPPAQALRGEAVEEIELCFRSGGWPEEVWVGIRAHPIFGEHGQPAGAVVVLRDVPGRHLALYRSLVESLGLSVFRKDASGRYVFVNDRFCRALGLSRGEVLGRTDEDLFTPAIAEKQRRDDRQVLAAAAVAEKIEEHRRADCGPRCLCGGAPAAEADGDAAEPTRWLQVLLGPVYDADGRLAGTQGAFWDVTRRMLAERQAQEAAAELKKANAELARSNADLEQFAYVASHDLQEPLRMVASFTQLLAKRYAGRLDPEADEFITEAVNGALRMKRLINDLLDYSRVTTRGGRPTATSARAAYDQAMENLQAALRDADARVTCGPLPTVWADPTQLTQVFQNLIGNAVKFCRGRRPLVHVSARPRGREWLFAVRDNGIGIEAKHLERIFAIFQRLHTREKYAGTGIGLALCKKIIERHGGRIWAESQPGVGSFFYFTLSAPDGQD
jgi:signal transduction histidine kinase